METPTPAEIKDLQERIIFMTRLHDYQRIDIDRLTKRNFELEQENAQFRTVLIQAGERLKSKVQREADLVKAQSLGQAMGIPIAKQG